jgi:hypothetical protein
MTAYGIFGVVRSSTSGAWGRRSKRRCARHTRRNTTLLASGPASTTFFFARQISLCATAIAVTICQLFIENRSKLCPDVTIFEDHSRIRTKPGRLHGDNDGDHDPIAHKAFVPVACGIVINIINSFAICLFSMLYATESR